MTAPEEIARVFASLHDGDIEAWEGDMELLRLRVDCRYIAERIEPYFEHFILEMRDVVRLELDCWTNESSPLVLTSLDDIFRSHPELIAAEVRNATIEITCYTK